MRCDPKTKCRRAKLHNKMIDNSAPFLDQLFWQYLCLAKHFWSFVNMRMFWWQYGWWHYLSQTQLASSLPSSGLDSWKFCNYSNEWPKTPTMIFTSLVGIIPPREQWLHGISRSQDDKSGIADAGRLTWVAEVCQS